MKTCKAKKMYGLAIMLFSIMLVSPTYAQNGPKGTLRVGAAKVDITPNQDELPPNSFGILDHIHSRAIVIDNNHTKAALVTVDIGGISDAQWKTITERVETEIGIPQNNIMITASHTHSGARLKPEVLNEKIFSSIKEVVEFHISISIAIFLIKNVTAGGKAPTMKGYQIKQLQSSVSKQWITNPSQYIIITQCMLLQQGSWI